MEVIKMAIGYGNIDKLHRERYALELNASDGNGVRLKLYVDLQTGHIIKTNRKERIRLVVPPTLLREEKWHWPGHSTCRSQVVSDRYGVCAAVSIPG